MTACNPVFFCPGSHSWGAFAVSSGLCPSKPFELPPAAAKAFVRDMKALFSAKDQLKQDEIASRQLHALAFQRPRENSFGSRT
jgi:hypothetical protein